MTAGCHIWSKTDRRSTKIVKADLLHAATMSNTFSISDSMLVCRGRPWVKPLFSSTATFWVWHYSRIRRWTILSIHFARFGSNEIGRSLFCAGYIPSLERQVILASAPLEKNPPSAGHLLKSTEMVPRYSCGSFLSKNAEVSALSNDFFGRNVFHSFTSSWSAICASGMLGISVRFLWTQIASLWKAFVSSYSGSLKCFS